MSDCFRVNDRSQNASERNTFSSVAQDQWNGRQNMCDRLDTASKHLPDLSISEGEERRHLLSKIDKLIHDNDNYSRHNEDYSRHNEDYSRRHTKGERSNDCSERRTENRGEDGSGKRSKHRWERRYREYDRDNQCGYSDQDDSGYETSNSGGCETPDSPGYESPDSGGYETPNSPGYEAPDSGGYETPNSPGYETPNTPGYKYPDSGNDYEEPVVDWNPTVPDTTIDELTQLSEQMLPVHANGSYPATNDWEGLHSANVERAKNAAQAGSDLEFFGDSITEAMGYDPAAMQPFKDNFGSSNPTSLGLGGDGTKQLLYRLNHGEMQGEPKAVVLNIGTNDIGSLSPAEIAENTQKSIESIQLRSPNSRIVLMGILPRTDAGDPGNYAVDATNDALSRLATTNGAVQFVNLKDSFVDANGNQRAELYQPDKLHLSSAGYRAWADGLKSTIQNIENAPEGPTTPYNPNTGGSGELTTLDTANIRGVNLSGAEWGKNSDADSQFWPTTQELDYYKSKGMNTVRLMLSWEQLQPQLNGPLNTAEMNRLHDFLREADERDMKVLVTGGSFARYTLNHGPNGQGADGQVNGTPVGQDGVPVSAMQDFWTRMVEHINADPIASRAVGGWDLTNEPHTMGGTWPTIATAVDQAIRATGDDHTIVVEGDQWARDFSGLENLAKMDKNVAFEAHSYWDDGSGGYANENPPADPNVGVNHIRNFVSWLDQNDAKGFVGEWGVPTNNTAWAPAIRNFIEYLEDNDMGNMVWAGGSGWGDGYKLSVEPINGQDRAIMSTIVEANQDD